jgi:ferredoxin-type protein NapF
MIQKYLKILRIFISLIFLISISFLFIDFRGIIPASFSDFILFLQFIPSVIKFINVLGYAAIGFIIIVIINILFGRVYCSTVCPLGILMDVISYLSKKFRIKKKFRFAKAHNFLRYSFLVLPFIFLLFGSIFLLNLLDPFSNYGRIFSDLVQPVVIGINNIISIFSEKANMYFIYPVNYETFNLVTALFPIAFLGFIIWISLYHGRLYCNTVCPVGTLLGLLSRLSIFKIKIDSTACTKCGKCIAVCKANCIDIKNISVDFSRCIACYNCIKPCPEDAIKYKFDFRKEAIASKVTTDSNKREFVTKSVIYVLGLIGLSKLARSQHTDNSGKKLIPVEKENPVSPPGSASIRHFINHCTACHLCVTACPTEVLQPSFLEYGFTGMMQPHMDYKTNYCNYECTICGEVCPTGAILPLTKEDKKLTQIGRVHFIMKNCIVYTDKTACGSCSEHCPTQAVSMVPYIEDLTIPFINPSTCVGCGACEYACPVEPHKAIYVDGNPVHQLAEAPDFEKLEKKHFDEFPF